MKRLLIIAALVAPGLGLLFFRLRPSADLLISVPLLHFYIVTFTTFSAAVISILIVIALEDVAQPRHLLAAAAFAVMGGLFFSHGLTTPQAIIDHFHPAIQWSAWLTLFTGGAMFALASLDRPSGKPAWLNVQAITYAAVGFVLLYSVVAAAAPNWLTALSQLANPTRRLAIFFITLGLWLFAAFRLWQTWRISHDRVDGALAFVAAWLGQASVSMHLFELNRLSWWMYHFILLGAFLFTAYVLVAQYERARQFRVIRYYVAASLILTALLALVASHLFAEFSYRTLVTEVEDASARLVSSVTHSVANSLPADLTADEARAEFVRRVSAEPLGELRIYSQEGQVLFPAGLARPAGDPVWQNYFTKALTGDTVVLVREPGDPPEGYEAIGAVHVIQTYTVIRQAGDPDSILGVVVTLREAPELSGVLVRARTTGLVIAAVTMGLLFAALALVVGRADRIITARANELSKAYTSLREAESGRDDLTHMIIHDLRTPLSVITASLDLIGRTTPADPAVDSRARFTRTARSAGRRMTGLIDDLLNVAKIEAGELKPRLEPTSIAALLADNLNDFTVQATAENRQFSFEYGDDFTADLDAGQIGRVLVNLVANAFKYTEKGGQIQVSACADPERGRVTFSVRDNGEGIPDEYKQQVFDKYVQVPTNGYNVRKGTGLGLAFCRLVVLAHGGAIWIEDAPGGGSDFKMWLPLKHNGR